MDRQHPSTPTAAQAYAVRNKVALSYIPAIMFRLDGDTLGMFAAVLQAMRDGGYEDGYEDGRKTGFEIGKNSVGGRT